jgi:hypothetical protein
MEPVIYKNGEFMEIVIPANTEFTSEMLLSKYGIHADVQFVDKPMTGGGTLTYPYAFFHWFFSIFSLRPDVTSAPTTIWTKDVETKDVETKDESKDESKDATPIGELKDETNVETPNNETKDDTNVELKDDTNVELKDETNV